MTDTVWELSCNLDDMTPEDIAFAMERLLDAGALDVWTTPIGMKKKFPTFFDASALSLDKIAVSAGMRGAQLLLDRAALMHFVDGKALEITGQTPT